MQCFKEIRNSARINAVLESERRKLRSSYKAEREEMIALATAKHNVDIFLGEPKRETLSHERDAR